MRNLNKPTRYNVASIQAQQTLGGDVMVADENGNYVEWRNYQWLLTEKQHLDSEVNRLQSIHSIDNIAIEQLKAEVERLTKAGDAMAKLLSCCGNPQSEVRGWHAAKGVQS
jgi:hypothetical protein